MQRRSQWILATVAALGPATDIVNFFVELPVLIAPDQAA
jgi:hypothetical protein